MKYIKAKIKQVKLYIKKNWKIFYFINRIYFIIERNKM